MHDKTDKVNCPNCGKGGTWTPSNAFRPFCSDRCKLIDLGGWASEEHTIPGATINPDNLENPDSSDDGLGSEQ